MLPCFLPPYPFPPWPSAYHTQDSTVHHSLYLTAAPLPHHTPLPWPGAYDAQDFAKAHAKELGMKTVSGWVGG